MLSVVADGEEVRNASVERSGYPTRALSVEVRAARRVHSSEQ
jgi:hypothetical protein